MTELTSDLALTVVRVAVGLVLAGHGAQKLFGWFGGYGLHTTGEFMVQLGFRNGRAFATAAGGARCWTPRAAPWSPMRARLCASRQV